MQFHKAYYLGALQTAWLAAIVLTGIERSVAQGSLVGWGVNDAGQSMPPTNIADVISVAAGYYHYLALRADGTVIAWGSNEDGQTNVPPALNRVVAVSASFGHSLALRDDGTIAAWGWNAYGQTDVPKNLKDVIAIAAGYYHGVAAKVDGTVVGWGLNTDGQAQPPPNLTGAVAVAAGYYHSLALKNDGTVVGWGLDNYGQSSVPPDLGEVVAIAAGVWHSMALKSDGTVVAWGVSSGPNNFGQTSVPTNLNKVVRIAAGSYHNLALKEDGTLVAWGDNSQGATTLPPDLSGIFDVAAGSADSLAILGAMPLGQSVGRPFIYVDGSVMWGTNVYARGLAKVSLRTLFHNGTLLFTLDGREPDFSANFYDGPFEVKKSATLRAVAYNADFSRAVQSPPLQITVIPALSASTDGGGTLAIDPPKGAYFDGSRAVVTAVPSTGWRFLQWLGDASGSNPTTTLTMVRDRHVKAIFGTTVSNAVVGNGSVVRSQSSDLYPYGSRISFTGLPQESNYLALWGNAASSTDNPLVFLVTNANPTVTAVFSSLGGSNSQALAIFVNGYGRVTNSLRGNRFATGTNMTLTALPDVGQDFIGWTGDANGSANPLAVTLNQSKTITANFTRRVTLRANAPLDGLVEGGFRLSVMGDFGAVYAIAGSTNLQDWINVGTVTNTYGTVQFTDPAATSSPNRFYRGLLDRENP